MNWPTAHDPLSASSWPIFDELGWADYWGIQDWITWHKAMAREYGVEAANRRFVQAWEQDSLTHAAPLSARSFDSNFRAYARDVGLLNSLYGQGLAVLAKPLGLVSDVGDVVSDIGQGVKTSGAWLRWLVPVAAVVLFIFYTRKAAAPALKS